MKRLQRVFILSAIRSPIAPKGGAMRSLRLDALGAQAVAALLTRCGIEAGDVNGVLLGNAMGAGGNVARLIALAAGLPEITPAQTIDTQCCSGVDAIALSAHRIAGAGGPEAWIAGGVESTSNAPLRARRNENGSPEFYGEAQFSPWPARNPSMLDAARALEANMGVSRDSHYDYAVASHGLSMRAVHLDRVPILIDGVAFDIDPHTRALSPELCKRAERPSQANPALVSPLADGAAVAIVVNESFLAVRGIAVDGLVEVVSSQQVGAPPEQPGLAIDGLMPWLIEALQAEASARDGEPVHIELMESFTAQAIANRRAIQEVFQGALQFARLVINPIGGLLALGHPIGASGAVLVARLVNQLGPGQLGLALIASAGGLASGLLLRRANNASSMR